MVPIEIRNYVWTYPPSLLKLNILPNVPKLTKLSQVEYSFGKILKLSGPGGQVICFVYDIFCRRSVFNEVND